MKKNIIFFVIDSYHYSRFKSQEEKENIAPFLARMEKEGLYCENMYSQAPYTEAALMSIKCGQNTLDFGGYLERYNKTPKTLFEAFQEAGYSVYYNGFQPQCYPSSLRRGVTDIYYNGGFDFEAYWSYRLYYYAELFKKKELNSHDWDYLLRSFDDNIKEWLIFFNELDTNSSSIEIIRSVSKGYDFQNAKELLTKQIEIYEMDKKTYIESVLKQGKSHPLFKIPHYALNNKVKNEDTKEYIHKKLTPILKKIRRINAHKNIANNTWDLKQYFKLYSDFFRKPSKYSLKNILKGTYILLNPIFDFDLIQRSAKSYPSFKNAPGTLTHINHFIKWENERENENPYFACIHVEDIHNPEMFFSYDTDDKKLLDYQVNKIKKYLESLPKDYKGSISHDLSLQYIDDMLKMFYDLLNKNGVLQDTLLVVTADHGYSFSNYPIRNSFVSNFYLENYKIPFVILGNGVPNVRIAANRSVNDIATTLLDLCNIKVPKHFCGHSLLDLNYEEQFMFIEYMGGGCPDISRREINFAVYNKDYFIALKAKLNDNLCKEMIESIYNIKNDPLQLNNLVNTTEYDSSQIEILFEQLVVRHSKLKKNI